jgi:hypothetical protein
MALGAVRGMLTLLTFILPSPFLGFSVRHTPNFRRSSGYFLLPARSVSSQRCYGRS